MPNTKVEWFIVVPPPSNCHMLKLLKKKKKPHWIFFALQSKFPLQPTILCVRQWMSFSPTESSNMTIYSLPQKVLMLLQTRAELYFFNPLLDSTSPDFDMVNLWIWLTKLRLAEHLPKHRNLIPNSHKSQKLYWTRSKIWTEKNTFTT